MKERDDDAEFLEAMEGVRPLERTQLPPQPRYFEPVQFSDRELEVIRALDALVSGKGPFDLRETDEVMEGCVPGLDPRVLVEEFIVESHARGLRCVRIVHGRGNRSPNGEAVLKPSLPRWLARGPARLIVLAWTAARQADGGAGASYVLLRKGPGKKPLPSQP